MFVFKNAPLSKTKLLLPFVSFTFLESYSAIYSLSLFVPLINQVNDQDNTIKP
jgi:hypothetical protein